MQGLPCSIHGWGNWDLEMLNNLLSRQPSNELSFKFGSSSLIFFFTPHTHEHTHSGID